MNSKCYRSIQHPRKPQSRNFHQHLMQNGDFRYFAQKIDKPSILVHSKSHRSIQHPRKPQSRNFHQHLMQNGNFRYFAQKIDKSCKNLKMLNDKNDLLFKPVLTRCNFNTVSLTSKKFFSGGSSSSSSSSCSSSSGYLAKNTKIRIWGGRVCRRWLEVATTLVAASMSQIDSSPSKTPV